MKQIGYIYINIVGDHRSLSYSDNPKPSDICLVIKTDEGYSIDDIYNYYKKKCERYLLEDNNLYNKIIEKIISYESLVLKKIGVFVQYTKGYNSDIDFTLDLASIS